MPEEVPNLPHRHVGFQQALSEGVSQRVCPAPLAVEAESPYASPDQLRHAGRADGNDRCLEGEKDLPVSSLRADLT